MLVYPYIANPCCWRYIYISTIGNKSLISLCFKDGTRQTYSFQTHSVVVSILQTLRCGLHPPDTQVWSASSRHSDWSSSRMKMESKAAFKMDFLMVKHNLINHVLHNMEGATCSQQCPWAKIQNKFFHSWVVSVRNSVTKTKETTRELLLGSRVLWSLAQSCGS